jgi:hypothetical protein
MRRYESSLFIESPCDEPDRSILRGLHRFYKGCAARAERGKRDGNAWESYVFFSDLGWRNEFGKIGQSAEIRAKHPSYRGFESFDTRYDYSCNEALPHPGGRAISERRAELLLRDAFSFWA